MKLMHPIMSITVATQLTVFQTVNQGMASSAAASLSALGLELLELDLLNLNLLDLDLQDLHLDLVLCLEGD